MSNTTPAAPSQDVPLPHGASHRQYVCALLGILLIAVLGLAAYWPSLHGGFIWDDELLLSNNDLVKAANGPYLFWFTIYPVDYWPMTNTSFWLEWRLWETNSIGYHVTNLVLHLASAIVLWLILRRLAIPGAWLAALLFTVHPVNVESVAWIAQRKNTLAMFFFLLSIWWYLRAEQRRGAISLSNNLETRAGTGLGFSYWLSLLAFLLAMLSKGSVAVLPLVLLGLLWWLRRRITLADVAKVAPFLLIAVVLTGVNIWFQKHRALETLNIPFVQRLLGAGSVAWFYLSKALAPVDLAFIYPRWNVRPGNLLWWLPLAAIPILTGALMWQRNGSKAGWIRPLLFAWGFFCVALLPVLGFVDVGFMQYSLVADHYQHLALIGVAALAAAAWSTWHSRAHTAGRLAARVVAVAVVATLTLLAWHQSALYADAVTLYQATLNSNPECWVAYNNLGVQLASSGRPAEAMHNFEQAIRFKPDYAEAHYNLGNSLSMAGRLDDARRQYELAIQFKPDHARAHNNFGGLLYQSGHLQEAMEQYQLALNSNPRYAEAHNNLGVMLAGVGRIPEAIGHFQQALQLDPHNVDAHHNLGAALLNVGRTQEAVEQFEITLQLQPKRLETYAKLAAAYVQLQQPAGAIATAQKAQQVARSLGQPELADRIEAWLKAYQAGQASAPESAPDFEPFR